jgi:hypothetical protein
MSLALNTLVKDVELSITHVSKPVSRSPIVVSTSNDVTTDILCRSIRIIKSVEEPHSATSNFTPFSNHARQKPWSSTTATEMMNASHDSWADLPQNSEYDMFPSHTHLLPTWNIDSIPCQTKVSSPVISNEYRMIPEANGFSFMNSQTPYSPNHSFHQPTSFHSVAGFHEEDGTHSQVGLRMQQQSPLAGYSSSPLTSDNTDSAPTEPVQER